MKYERLCKSVLDAVGGRENIREALHCITRLRIVPVDKDKVDFGALKRIDGIIQVMDAAGQVQLVIGTQVEDVYGEFCEIAGISEQPEVDADANVDDGDIIASIGRGNADGNWRKHPVASLLDVLAAIVTPALYGIIAGGMLKGVTATVTSLGWVASTNDAIVVLNAIADAPFYFMPFVCGYAAAKRFKINPVYGICVAAMLMYPTFLSPADGVTSYRFLVFDIPAVNYKDSIFPVILSVWVFSYVFRFIDRRMHKNLRVVFSGFLSFLIAGPIIMAFVAPLGNYLALGLVAAFRAFFGFSGPLAGAVFCGIIPLTIIFGIKGWSVVELGNLQTLGYDYMLPMFFYSNLAVSGAVLAASLKLPSGSKKSAAVSTGLLAILGVTEPALYGTAVGMKTPLYASIAGGAVAGAVAMLLGVHTFAFSMPGITSIATYIDGTNNFFMLLVTMAVAWVAGFAISFASTKRQAA